MSVLYAVRQNQKAPFGELRDYERMYEEIKATKGSLVKEFESKTKAVWDGEKKSGKINARRLASLQAGNTAVFRQRRVAKAKKTSVTLLVDCSGSMNDRRKNHQAFKVATLLPKPATLPGLSSKSWVSPRFTTRA
jgi:cobalamin biosynthesis protein CobT